jgi:hypothetical protein
MPILSYETHQWQQKSRRIVSDDISCDGDSQTELLIKAHLPTLHCRRTLDQVSYCKEDRVLARWAKHNGSRRMMEARPALMVDQLWLWVADDVLDNSDGIQPHLLSVEEEWISPH